MIFGSSLIYGFAALIGFGIANSLIRVQEQHMHYRLVVAYRNIVVAFIAFAAALFVGLPQINADFWIYSLATAAIGVIAYLALSHFFQALSIGKVGVVTPIANSSLMLTIVLSVIFFQEQLHMVQVSAICMILFGVILLSIDFSHVKESLTSLKNSGIFLASVTFLFWGFQYFFLKFPVDVLGPFMTAAMLELTMFLIGISIIMIKKETLVPTMTTPDWTRLAFMIFFTAIAVLGINLGITYAKVTIVAAMMAASPLISEVCSAILYKETLSPRQWVASAIIVFAVILLSIF